MHNRGFAAVGLTAAFLVMSAALPARAAPLIGVKQVAAGSQHTCALFNNGKVGCWGNNVFGQLGDGTNAQRLRAVTVIALDGSPLTGVAEIASENYHTCARLTNGHVRCWGSNTGGQLGNNSTRNSNRAVAVQGPGGTGELAGAVQVTVGSAHSCIRRENKQAFCWGWNDNGQLGDNSNTNRHTPVGVLNETGTGVLTAIKTIAAAGGARTCASFTNKIARCWGWGGISGQLGNGSADSKFLPTKVTKLENSQTLTQVAEIAPGGVLHTCARLTTGQARCWGHNQDGQVGDGTASQRFRAAIVSNPGGPLDNIVELAGGGAHSCALLKNGTARCWGLNDSGQIGNNTTAARRRPTAVKAVSGPGLLKDISQIAAGGRFPVDCCQLTGGVHHTCVVLENRQVRCWGNNSFGQLGDGSKINRKRPVVVQAPPG